MLRIAELTRALGLENEPPALGFSKALACKTALRSLIRVAPETLVG